MAADSKERQIRNKAMEIIRKEELERFFSISVLEEHLRSSDKEIAIIEAGFQEFWHFHEIVYSSKDGFTARHPASDQFFPVRGVIGSACYTPVMRTIYVDGCVSINYCFELELYHYLELRRLLEEERAIPSHMHLTQYFSGEAPYIIEGCLSAQVIQLLPETERRILSIFLSTPLNIWEELLPEQDDNLDS